MAELIHTHKGTVYAQRNGVLIPVNTDGLVGYWPMTQGSGGTLYDESKNGNDGTLNNGPVWTDTANGKALSFDGVDDWIDCGNNESIKISGDVTIGTWIKAGSWSDYNPIIHFIGLNHNSNSDSNFLYMIEGRDGDITIGHEYGTGINVLNTYNTNLNTGQWYHLVAVRDDTADTWKLYVDDSQFGSDFDYSNNVEGGSASFLHIGGDGGIHGNGFDGIIDEVRIYNRALSAQEIINIYEKTRGLFGV